MVLPTQYQTLWTVHDIVKYLQVSERTVRRWIQDGRLTAVKIGGHWRVHRKEVDRLVRRSNGDGGNDL